MKARKGKARNAASQSAADLPEAVLVSILQHVDLKHRLSCSLVCKAWAAAVSCTTADIQHSLYHVSQCQHLQTWLRQCGEQVQGIVLRVNYAGLVDYAGLFGRFSDLPELELPCSKLTQLQRLSLMHMWPLLHTGHARATTRSSRSKARSLSYPAAADSHAGPAAGAATALLPQLQQLRLESCSVLQQHFLQLSKLTSLLSFELRYTHVFVKSRKRILSDQEHCAALQSVLQHLTQLTKLSLAALSCCSAVDKTAAVQTLAPISNMQGLQSLTLDEQACPYFDDLLPVLPTGLAALDLDGGDITPAPTAMQAISRLANLQELVLTDVWFDPKILHSVTTRLRRLVLEDSYFATADFDEPNDEVMLGQMFSAVGRLTQLQTLEISGFDIGVPESLACFSGLTASSQLTALRMTDKARDALPQHALEYMLPAGKQLQQLRVLHLEGAAGNSTVQGCVSAADISSIGICCPALTELVLRSAVASGENVIGLAALQSSLQSLDVEGVGFGDEAAAVVAQLTNLHSLRWHNSGSPALTETGLQQLTALKGLTSLMMISCPAIQTVRSKWMGVNQSVLSGNMSLSTTDEAQPDVWKQIPSFLRAREQGGGARDAARLAMARAVQARRVDAGVWHLQVAHCVGGGASGT